MARPTSIMHQANWRQSSWLALLVGGSVALSLGFACATPFAAFAAAAALTLPRNDALLAVAGVWFANQAVGFLFLQYPLTADCFAWSVALGIGIGIAAILARSTADRLSFAGKIIASLSGFTAAFAGHQLFLWVLAATLLGGTEEFAPSIVAQIFAVNAATFIGLLALSWLADTSALTSTRMACGR
jgi:hypothetical protein